MRPGHINVFDGLRITTEHLNHLQGSLHSAVQDIREILGLGTVQSGYDVVAEGNSVTISPGIAFDYQKNRVACDESKTIEVSFAPGETTKYVCLKYDQIEDGEVEGHFTLIWDSCAIDLRLTPPPANENVIAIAKVEKIDQNGSSVLQVTRLGTGENGEVQSEELDTKSPPAEEDESESETLPEEETEPASDTSPAVVAAEEAPASSTTPPTNGVSTTPSPTDEVSTSPSPATEVSTTPASTGTETSAAENSPQPPAATTLGPGVTTRVNQGVTRLAPANGPVKLASAAVIDSLTRNAAEPAPQGSRVSIPLAEAEVFLSFPLLSLSCETILSGSLRNENDESGTGSTFSTRAQGEVTIGSDGISQFGVSTTQVVATAGSMPFSFNELSEYCIAYLPLRILAQVSKNGRAAGVSDFVQRLALLIEVSRAGASGFKLTCSLGWRGGVTVEEIKEFENKGYVFEWEALIAWKALGVSQ
jgi:hypothetical protein